MKQLCEKYIVDEKGRKSSVIISLKKYQELLEDVYDLAIIAERKNEHTISFNELKKKLKTDGLI